jgi:hypothetical protein
METAIAYNEMDGVHERIVEIDDLQNNVQNPKCKYMLDRLKEFLKTVTPYIVDFYVIFTICIISTSDMYDSQSEIEEFGVYTYFKIEFPTNIERNFIPVFVCCCVVSIFIMSFIILQRHIYNKIRDTDDMTDSPENNPDQNGIIESSKKFGNNFGCLKIFYCCHKSINYRYYQDNCRRQTKCYTQEETQILYKYLHVDIFIFVTNCLVLLICFFTGIYNIYHEVENNDDGWFIATIVVMKFFAISYYWCYMKIPKISDI